MPIENDVSDESPVIAADVPAPTDSAEADPPPDPVAQEKAETKRALSGVQKRIDELTRARYEAEERGAREAEGWRQQAMQMHQQLVQTQGNIQPPKLDQYQDIEAYTAATAQFHAQRAAQAERQAAEQQFAHNQQLAWQQQQQANAQIRFRQVIDSKVQEATKKYPDFAEVVGSPELPNILQTHAFGAILESDHGAEVMYYLGKNPAKAHQLVSLSPMAQVREIGRIETMLSTGRAVTGAPPPPDTVGGNKGGASKDPTKMNYDEFVAYRRRQIAQRR